MTTYHLVPVEPSEEMLNAGYTAALPIYRDEGCEPNPNDYRAIWKAMLASAPVPQNELLEAAKAFIRWIDADPVDGRIEQQYLDEKLVPMFRTDIRNYEQGGGG